MTTPTHPNVALARRQHDTISHAQLLRLGFTRAAIRHMVASGRLFPLFRGVYAVGRPRVTRKGEWMASVLACGSAAVLSHESAAALWGIRLDRRAVPEVTVPHEYTRRRRGITVHRSRTLTRRDVTRRDGIPVTTVIRTLIDLTARLEPKHIERAINEADRLGLTTPERLRRALVGTRHGEPALRKRLDRRTFRLTDSELERMLLPIVLRAGLPLPLTKQRVNGYPVDFYWPGLGLVVETDGLRYHRTPAQQARDLERDHAHAVAEVERLRFSHEQVAFEPGHVERTLVAVAARLTDRSLAPSGL